jgi:transcriptional regulator with XRE-family HTH domain
LGKVQAVSKSLNRQLGVFLRMKRGEATYREFARKLGISVSTLYRLEQAEQSITLGKLEDIMDRLKCELSDIFPSAR